MNTKDRDGEDREQQPDPGEARVQQLITKTIARNERRLRRLAKE